MITQIQKLLERTASTAAVSFESIGPDSYYAALGLFLPTGLAQAVNHMSVVFRTYPRHPLPGK
jgi:hypothetical protein